MKKLTIIFVSLFIIGAAYAGERGGSQHGKRGNDDRPAAHTISVKQSSNSESRTQAKASARASAIATGGSSTGGNSEAAGGSATATGGQVVVNGSGNGNGLTGRMVPDISATSPLTSTSCRNGITAGGSGNGWGGLLGFFSEDDMCEWRLLEASYRNSGDLDKANAIRSGMTLQRCEKLAPKEREMFGDLCPKAPVQESQNPAFASAG